MDPRINISWGDWMLEEDNKRNDYYLNLSDMEWEELVRDHLRNFKGDIRSAVAWVERVQQARIARNLAKAEERPREKPSQLDIMFNLWKDMIEEPEKYDDWEEWLEMDEELRNSNKRWRVAAFWQKKQDEADEVSRAAFIQMLVDAQAKFENRMATRIQSAWRGHKVRDIQPQLNCGICLAHKPAPHLFYGKVYACTGCLDESRKEDEEYDSCNWCSAPLYEGQTRYCDYDCELSAIKDDIRAEMRYGGW